MIVVLVFFQNIGAAIAKPLGHDLHLIHFDVYVVIATENVDRLVLKHLTLLLWELVIFAAILVLNWATGTGAGDNCATINDFTEHGEDVGDEETAAGETWDGHVGAREVGQVSLLEIALNEVVEGPVVALLVGEADALQVEVTRIVEHLVVDAHQDVGHLQFHLHYK